MGLIYKSFVSKAELDSASFFLLYQNILLNNVFTKKSFKWVTRCSKYTVIS